MAEFEVWSEGYAATGERSPAYLHGKVEATSFDEACIKILGADRLDKNSDGTYRRGGLRGNMAPGITRTEAVMKGGNYSIWDCQLFDNESDARALFG